MPSTELIVVITSIQFDVLGSCSNTFLNIYGTFLILDIIV